MEEPRNYTTAEFEKLSEDLRNAASTCFIKCNSKGFSDSTRLNACVGKEKLKKSSQSNLDSQIFLYFYVRLVSTREPNHSFRLLEF